jgi:hypothetical protein
LHVSSSIKKDSFGGQCTKKPYKNQGFFTRWCTDKGRRGMPRCAWTRLLLAAMKSRRIGPLSVGWVSWVDKRFLGSDIHSVSSKGLQ